MNSAGDRRLQVGRLETFAALSGGVTHELGNLAASATMSAQLLADCCRDDADRAALAALKELATRILHAGRQLHWLARGIAGEPTLFQPQYLLADLQKLAAVAFHPAAAVLTRYPADLLPLFGEPLHVFQLALSLALEAHEHLRQDHALILSARNAASEGGAAPRQGPFVVLEAGVEPSRQWADAPAPPAAEPTPRSRRSTAARRRADLTRLAQATGARLELVPTDAGRYQGRRAWLVAADIA